VTGDAGTPTPFRGALATPLLATALAPAALGAPETKLEAPMGVAGAEFGTAVSVDGDTVVVGAWKDGASAEGAVCVYVRCNGVLPLQTKLTADSPAADDEFGRAVAVQEHTLVVGAPGRDAGG
jgi:hypothetical protein